MTKTVALTDFVENPSDIYSINFYLQCDNFCTLKIDSTTLINHAWNYISGDGTTQGYKGYYFLSDYNFLDSSTITLKVDDDYRWDPVVSFLYSLDILLKSR